MGLVDIDYFVYGILVGVDYIFEDIGLLLGVVFSYFFSISEVDVWFIEVDGNIFCVLIYGGKVLGKGYIVGVMLYF